jgi:hypothetical protein
MNGLEFKRLSDEAKLGLSRSNFRKSLELVLAFPAKLFNLETLVKNFTSFN